MKQRRKMITALVATAALAVTLTGCAGGGSGDVAADCQPKHEFSTIKDGTLSVVLYDLPPFSKLDNGAITGVDGDIMTEFAKEECLTITATSAATSANIPTVQAGRADVSIAAWYRTQARSEIVLLSDPIYTDQMAIISKDGLSSVSELEGQTVGTVDGYLWVEDMRAVLGDKLKIYPTTLNMNQDLAAGRIDIGIDSYGSATHNNTDNKFKVEVVQPDERVAASQEAAQIAIPVAPGNEALVTAINDFIKVIREDGRLEKILVDNGLDATAADTGDPRLI
ncbi:amino acid ABC transporter substrate-binding protein [Gulosibacter macacae]|uniref:Amino acid ABC transporter substrate-binding protein n=1 Tax=Gulosibacter macacae TaxID=2488791 RepID=A0A3P3VZ02_9MICO|nr:ABC transporter substrate-binding protein [Gulosibacter macacae]RRJ87940.1 amino acid ABC transporter substrate-binding protein [Gulosibacter macacae]